MSGNSAGLGNTTSKDEVAQAGKRCEEMIKVLQQQELEDVSSSGGDTNTRYQSHIGEFLLEYLFSIENKHII